MNKLILTIIGALSVISCNSTTPETPDKGKEETPPQPKEVAAYVSTDNESTLFQYIGADFNTRPTIANNKITLNKNTVYQEIDGFGAAITGSTCYNLLLMSKEDRTRFLKETFDHTEGMGYSYVRIAIGCCDFSLDEYTLCDTPPISNFALQNEELNYVIPILKEILAINPTLKIMGSPWTCPRWMKVNNLTDLKPFNSWKSGQLNPIYYDDYATYFVNFIKAMSDKGININAITLQNEPLNRGNSASLYMTWQEQAKLIKKVGPKLKNAGFNTKIIVYDHNYNYDNISNQQQYPLQIYADAEAAQWVDGAAYHAYGGNNSELNAIHQAKPEKNLYFTEMSIGTWSGTSLLWDMKELGIGTLNKWNKAVIVWNLLLDENGAPNRPGGCTTCYGAVTINSVKKNYASLQRRSHFYAMAHLAKVIKPGAKRIATSGFSTSGFEYTAVLNPDGSYGMVYYNNQNQSQSIQVYDGKRSFNYTIPAKGIVSMRWKSI